MPSFYSNVQMSRGIAQLLFYQTANGNMDVPWDYVTPDRFPLGEFVRDIRTGYMENRFSSEQIKKLTEIGFSMDKDLQAWESMYLRIKKYVEEHKGRLPKATEHTADFILIGAWVRKQRLTFYRLSEKQQAKLREVGICGK
ncbi:MAG: helicase associated domain-containing protein [Lachnospiraceae bacterium]|nr:helicase associated domain-containing protein [Lachnospiraceae bacterium]